MFAAEIEKVSTPVLVDNEGSRPEKRQSSGGGPSMAATGLCLSPGNPTRSDVSDTGFPIVSSPNLYRPVARIGAIQVPPQQFEPSSKKDYPPTMLTLSLPRIETYENKYKSPHLDYAPHHNKVVSLDNQSALTFTVPKNPEPMTFVQTFSLCCFGQRHSYRQVRQGLRTTKLCLRGHSHWNTGVERRRSLGQLPFSVLLFVSSPVSLGSGEELVLFGFRRQEATIPRTVEELKGKSVLGVVFIFH
ncbi:unnamed protein product, partial [Vitis vinifera]